MYFFFNVTATIDLYSLSLHYAFSFFFFFFFFLSFFSFFSKEKDNNVEPVRKCATGTHLVFFFFFLSSPCCVGSSSSLCGGGSSALFSVGDFSSGFGTLAIGGTDYVTPSGENARHDVGRELCLPWVVGPVRRLVLCNVVDAEVEEPGDAGGREAVDSTLGAHKQSP
eukprot:TRINITY_DN1941_c0_g1_i1.p1 TRINITY_DN1941_c0_g1~~TRINITY_DN1941_c0_g1_i1.p1  ORF type:complete len:167 (-),score=46.63 TRINITY_DN1941_c0_g1_i1:87-587(-)